MSGAALAACRVFALLLAVLPSVACAQDSPVDLLFSRPHLSPLPAGADASKSLPEMASLWGSKRNGQASARPRSE